MRIAFAGTPAFSLAPLNALHAAGHTIVAVYSQPDRPFGRGQKLTPSPVAQRAIELGLPVFKPEAFRREPEAIAQLAALAPELMVVVAFGQILPQAVLDIPRHGCLNIHASLLPRWRGAAPIQRAILADDADTGTTIMQMEAGLDTGPMLLREALAIGRKNAAELHDELSAQGARLIVQALAQLATLQPVTQPDAGVTYASKLSKDEARINWALSAETLARQVRGYNPAPVAWCQHGDERIKVFAAHPLAAEGPPGLVLAADSNGLVVACGSGALQITQLQRPGGKPLAAPHIAASRSWQTQGFT